MKVVFRLLLLAPAVLVMSNCQLIGPALNSALRLWPYLLVGNAAGNPAPPPIETRARRIQNAHVYEGRSPRPQRIAVENIANR